MVNFCPWTTYLPTLRNEIYKITIEVVVMYLVEMSSD
jgi:hypothetical protein